jgi:hypothetical protein
MVLIETALDNLTVSALDDYNRLLEIILAVTDGASYMYSI